MESDFTDKVFHIINQMIEEQVVTYGAYCPGDRVLREARRRLEALIPRPTFKPLPTYGDHMLLSDFLDSVRDGLFIDYDGHGQLASVTERSNIEIQPSTIHQILYRHPEYLTWATHVVWYNK